MTDTDFSKYRNEDGTYPDYIQFLIDKNLQIAFDMFSNPFLMDENRNVYTPSFTTMDEVINYLKDNLTNIKVRYLKLS